MGDGTRNMGDGTRKEYNMVFESGDGISIREYTMAGVEEERQQPGGSRLMSEQEIPLMPDAPRGELIDTYVTGVEFDISCDINTCVHVVEFEKSGISSATEYAPITMLSRVRADEK